MTAFPEAVLMTIDQARGWIDSGATLAIAGDMACLRQLPKGNWMGGTTPYFMAEGGGTCRDDRVFVHGFGGRAGRVVRYDCQSLPHLLEDAPENGFTLLILPAGSQVLEEYACHAPGYVDMYLKPLAGWVSGVRLERVEREPALVIDGRSGETFENQAIAVHLPLPSPLTATVHAVSLFAPGDGPTIEFPATGFNASDCVVDGRAGNLAAFMAAHSVDQRWPLVADYCGATINVSIQSVDTGGGQVRFFAPVYQGVRYRFARPVSDYPARLQQAMPATSGTLLFGCNCILNYLYSELQGQRTGELTGPFTFGEVAYQLLNQTAVFVTLDEA
ncbi:DUF6976 family protein [Marinobacter sp. SS21]|uniref:DUF6976 family protein n=1 Tax=Marinobacter sp. SS21 TaxID=2979460 RepID=UPI00232B81A8|nr:hypothetical protein [Marinobacter sp. SS21]MDC0662410.1 hypothetical protein [Marinobacter sp. SS21]